MYIMDKQKIQLLLNKHGKTISGISRELSVNPSSVSRTISSDRACSSRRIRLHISKILGLKPSEIFDLQPKDRFFEDHVYCSSLNDSVASS
jgi:lambda repressor-like predicted transcriptional regulator